LPHDLKDFFQAWLPHLIGDSRQTKCIAQDTGVGTAVHGNGIDRQRMPQDRLHARRKGARMDATLGVKQGPINVEEIGVALIPAKSFLDGYQALGRRWDKPAGYFLH
jgi:hypothetical protein